MVAHHRDAPTEPSDALISPAVQFARDVAEQFAGKDVKKDKSSRALTIAAPISREDHRVQGGNTRIGGSEMSERLRAPRLPPIFFGDHNGRLAGLSAGPLRFDSGSTRSGRSPAARGMDNASHHRVSRASGSPMSRT